MPSLANYFFRLFGSRYFCFPCCGKDSDDDDNDSADNLASIENCDGVDGEIHVVGSVDFGQ